MARGGHFPSPSDDAEAWGRGRGRSEGAAKRRGRGGRSWRQRVLLGLGVAVAVGSLAGASGVFYVLRSYQGIERYEDIEVDQVAAGEPENYLIVGSDDRTGTSEAEQVEVGGHRSDTIMVLRIDPETESASVLSFQRDLMVPIAGTDGEVSKINSAYAHDRQTLIDTIKSNFGIDIHHYVEIDWGGFRTLIDQIGGVPLYFSAAVKDDDAGLFQDKLGCVNVNADQALAFSRSRKLSYMTEDGWEYDVTSDHGRITRQQILMRQALHKALKQARSNPLQLKDMLDLASGSVGLDQGLGLQDLLDLADRFKDFGSDGLQTYSLPMIEVGEVGSADIYPDMPAAEPILNVFRGLPFDEVGPSLVTVEVANGSGDPDQGANVTGALDALGFEVAEPTTVATRPTTAVQYSPGEGAFGRRVARHLTSGAALSESADLEKGHVRLITGADFTTLHEMPIPADQIPLPTTTAPPGASTTTTSASTTTTTAAPASTTTLTPPTTAPRLGYAAGEAPPGITCG